MNMIFIFLLNLKVLVKGKNSELTPAAKSKLLASLVGAVRSTAMGY